MQGERPGADETGLASGRVLPENVPDAGTANAGGVDFERIFVVAPGGVAIFGPDGRPVFINRVFSEMLGRAEDGSFSKSLFDVIHPEDLDEGRRRVERILSDGAGVSRFEGRFIRGDGDGFIWAVAELALVGGEEISGPSYLVLTLWEGEVKPPRESEETYRRVIENVGEIVFHIDDDGRWSFLNPAWAEITGFPVAQTLGERADKFMRCIPGDVAGDSDPAMDTGANSGRREVVITTAAGDSNIFEVSFASPPAGDGFARSFGILHDITERKLLEERLQRLAMHDPLTDLPNRRLFMKRLRTSLSTEGGGMVSLVFVDIDDFKLVNDDLGHEVGDSVLVAVAGRLRGCMRSTDTVARLGGEEFAVLMVGAAGEEAENAARRILEVFERPFSLDSGTGRMDLSVSVGISISDSGDPGPEDLLRRADVAMYRAKGRGGSDFAFYDEG